MSQKIVKKDLAEKLADKFGITKKLAKDEVDFLIDSIVEELLSGNSVALNELGKFEVKTKEARVGINPSTKEKIEIPAKRALSFKVASTLKDSLN